jgi:acetyl esterase/lipase
MVKMKFSRSLFFVPIVCLVSCQKFEETEEVALDPTKPQKLYHISYGNNSRQTLDIALPQQRSVNTPVVIFIHGGAWVTEDKSTFTAELQQFSDAGVACAAINYRLVSDITNIKHYDLVNDVNAAVDFIASKSKLWHVSPDRFGLVGQRAGGTLALSAAYARTDNKVKACASWGGYTNFIEDKQWKISGTNLLFKTYVGMALETKSDTLKYKFASPFWNVNTYSVPTLLVHGSKDANVSYANAAKMQKKLAKLKVQNSLVTLDANQNWAGKNMKMAREATLSWFQGKL